MLEGVKILYMLWVEIHYMQWVHHKDIVRHILYNLDDCILGRPISLRRLVDRMCRFFWNPSYA